MSIFNNPDFLALKPLDLENKLFLPTSKLYDQTVWRLNSLYQEIKEVLINFHGKMAYEAGRFYDHPIDIVKAWYEQAIENGADVYASVLEEVVPKAEAVYQQAVVDATELGQQAGEFWQAFYDNPEAVTVSLMIPIVEQFNSIFNASQGYLSSSLEASEAYVIGFYSAIVDLFNLLLEQPEATLTALYQNSLSALLNTYFELISMLLGVL